MWLFGGGGIGVDDSLLTSNEVFKFTLGTWYDAFTCASTNERAANKRWERMACTGDIPPSRLYHSTCAVGTKMYIYGGAPHTKTTYVIYGSEC